jgi:Tfp pilus assembly protein FimT
MNKAPDHRNGKLARAFTLLEMVFVLGLIMVVATWGIISVSTVETEQKLRDALGGIEALAKRARNVAVKQQRPYRLTISDGSVAIAPHNASLDLGDDWNDPENDDYDVAREDFEDVTATEATDSEVTYEVKRWRSDDWQLIEGDKKVVISLDPMGLIEPISIRCSIGESWLVHELHPLTAGVREEEMSIEME